MTRQELALPPTVSILPNLPKPLGLQILCTVLETSRNHQLGEAALTAQITELKLPNLK